MRDELKSLVGIKDDLAQCHHGGHRNPDSVARPSDRGGTSESRCGNCRGPGCSEYLLESRLCSADRRQVMAKKAPAKPPAKRKPRAKKPVDVPIVDTTDYGTPVEFPAWLVSGLKAIALLVLGSLGGIWAAGGIDVSPSPGPTGKDCLQVAHAADRVSQVAVLRELAAQPFDGATDDGRRKAGEWFTQNRFKNRASDFTAYTDRVAEAIASNSEDALANELQK